jgi:hypothetical protein
MKMASIGKWLVVAGAVIAVTGALLFVAGRVFPSLGDLPGDLHLRGEKGELHFPVVTCLVVSAVLTLVINLVLRLFRG